MDTCCVQAQVPKASGDIFAILNTLVLLASALVFICHSLHISMTGPQGSLRSGRRAEDTRNSDLTGYSEIAILLFHRGPHYGQALQGHGARNYHGHFKISLVPVAPSHLPLPRSPLRSDQVKGGSTQARAGDKNQSPQPT